MKQLKLYLETSVWNFYFADDAPEKKAETRQFFEQVKHGYYTIYISEIVLNEIARAPEEKRQKLLNLIREYQPITLKLNMDIVNLAQQYLQEGALPKKADEDAQHAAIATIYELDALISWNLRHLANLRRMEKLTGST